MSKIEREYERRVRDMTPQARVEKSVAMFCWSRDLVARQILATAGPMDMEQLKWEVALRMYGSNSQSKKLIQRQLDRVSS